MAEGEMQNQLRPFRAEMIQLEYIMDDKELKLTDARGTVLLNLLFSKKLTDEFISPEELELLRTKTYPEWPKELQTKLEPFGAKMIVEQTSLVSPSQATPGTSSPSQSAPSTRSGSQWGLDKVFSLEELQSLRTIPFKDLPEALKAKATEHRLDQMPPEMTALSPAPA